MKGIDLSNYALEDLLSFDDIFLDYFNNFLKCSAFPQSVQYNRFLSVFEEINPTTKSLAHADRLPKRPTAQSHAAEHHSFSSNDTEQNRVFDWVRKERLPLFFRTNLFREFKLCKLLVRPIDDDRDSTASSQNVGGYSRQSPPNSNTLSTEEPEDSTTGRGIGDSIPNDEVISPSVYYPELEKFNKQLFQRPGSRAFSVPAFVPFFTLDKVSLISAKKKFQKRPPTVSVESSSKNSKESKNMPVNLKAVINGEKADLKRQPNFEDLTRIDKTSGQPERRRSVSSFHNKNNNNNNNNNNQNGRQNGNGNNGNENNGNGNGNGYPNASTRNNKRNPNDIDLINFDFNDDFNGGTNTNAEYYDDEGNGNGNGYDSEFDDDVDENDTDQLSINDDVIDDLIESDKVHGTINQYKLKYLGSVRGMNDFRDFLRTTSNGDRFIKFWLDCEFFRDSMQDYDQVENMATRNRLFRDIIEKYVFAFSGKVNEKIRESYADTYGLNHHVFVRIQYDILRRLRSYWIPRFILHKLHNDGKSYGSYPLPPLTPEYSRQSTYNTIPSSVKSAPPGHKRTPIQGLTELNDDQRRTLYEKVRQALYVDKEAGGPFLRFISIHYPDFLPLVLFWYDVLDFGESYVNGCDKNSRMQHAWAIYNSYLSPTARFDVGCPQAISQPVCETLQKYSNLANEKELGDLDENVFQPVTEFLINFLESPWIGFLKDDVMKYTEARLASFDLSRDFEESTQTEPQPLPEPEIEIKNDTVFIKRPWMKKLLLGQTATTVASSVRKPVMTEERRLELARRRKIMEIERRKALKAARERMRFKKNKSSSAVPAEELPPVEENAGEEGDMSGDHETTVNRSTTNKTHSRPTSTFVSDKSVFFDKMLANNKSMMQLLRKHMVDGSNREVLNRFNFYLDARQYLEALDSHKKNAIGGHIQKTYLEQSSKKNILPLPEKLQSRLQMDVHMEQRGGNGRPRTPFMVASTKEYRAALEDEFYKFCETQSKELGLQTPEDFATLTQAELLLLMGDSYNTKDFDFDEEKGDGKMLPSKEDRAEFLKLLMEWSMGRTDLKFYSFYAHLTEHGKKDGFPFLEKDLLFCIDAIRLKEISGGEVLHRKGEMILELYLQSSTTPALQVDINHDAQQKLLKSLSKIMQNTHSNSDFSVFDDIRAQLFKDLLPYWSGFKHSYKPSDTRPLTKAEKILKERLDEFLTAKEATNEFKLPPISGKRKDASHGTLQITFSLSTGIKLKDEKLTEIHKPVVAHAE